MTVLKKQPKSLSGLADRTKLRKRMWKNRWMYLMMLPGLIYLLINNYIPMAGLVIAFKKINFSVGIWKSPWNGLKNFKYLFATKDAFIITRNTILYNVAFIILITVTSLFVAIALSEVKNKLTLSVFQGSLLVPYIVSYVVVSYLVFAFLGSGGFFNKTILPALGINPINWYQEAKYWPFILVFVNNWKNIGYSSVIYMATIVGFDSSIYEAASLDGATYWQKVRLITIPLLKPTIITMVMLSIGRIFYSDFGLFYQVTQNSGTILKTTNVIDTYVYRGLLERSDIAMSSAAGFYQAVVGFIVVMAANALVKKISPEDSLF